MFCPRCGAETEEDVRYCPSCGNELRRGEAGSAAEEGKEGGGARAGLKRLIGEDRRTRLLTLGTVLAIAIAIIAFIALDPADEEEASVPQDALTRQLDAVCVQHKGEIASAQRQAIEQGGGDAGAEYAESFIPIVGEWRAELGQASVPNDRVELVDALKATLLEVQIEAGAFARTLRESNRSDLATAAGNLEAATENVESAIGALELRRCSRLTISQGRLVRQ